MTRLEALKALKEAVEAGTLIPDNLIISDEISAMIDLAVNVSDLHGDAWADLCNAYDGSLDAASGLHGSLLPRHYAQVHMWPMPEMSRVDIGGGHTGRDDCTARAWLLAILSALIAQEVAE